MQAADRRAASVLADRGVLAQGAQLFTTIESENNLKVVDTRTDKVVDAIALTGRPNQCASTPDGRYVGVPIRNGNSVDIVDTAERKVVKVLPVLQPHNCYNAGNDDAIFVSSMGGFSWLRDREYSGSKNCSPG